jgi:hypothetical protein
MRQVITVAFIWVLLVISAKAVRELVEIEEPQPAQQVEGFVLDPSGAPIEGMTVTDRSEEWGTLLRSTTTDKRGQFRFSPQPNKTVYYLRFDHALFNPLQLKLKLDKKTRNRAITVKAPIGG